MSGLINKVKEVVTGHHADTTSPSHSSPTTGTTGTTGHHTQGPHSSDMANRADPRVDSDGDGRTGLTGSGNTSATSGPHSSDLANRMDPRVDSDRDGRSGLTGSGHTSATSGPHSSDLANRMDPRVDSDRDGRSGLAGTGRGLAGTGSTSSTAGPYSASGTQGPHSSDLANKMDPRVDSDGDRNRGVTGGSGLTGSSTSPTHLPAGVTPKELVHGHHTTVTGERLDPHVPSGTQGTGITTVSPSGSGSATGLTGSSGLTGTHNTPTSGPHNSNLLNKLDPRVDSDRDGSKLH